MDETKSNISLLHIRNSCISCRSIMTKSCTAIQSDPTKLYVQLYDTKWKLDT